MALRDASPFFGRAGADISAKRPVKPGQIEAPAPAAVATLQGVNILSPSVFWLSICAAVVPAVAAAQAQPPAGPNLPATALPEALALVGSAARALAPAGARIEVAPGRLDPRLRLAACSRVQPFLPAGARPWGASRVGLRCVQGIRPWSVTLPVTVHVFARAPVAPGALPPGSVIDSRLWVLAEVDWAAGPSAVQPQADALQGRVLARALAPGQPVRAADLRPRQWFAAGETVRVVAVGGGFSVSSEGQALSAGIEGQIARVRTDNGRVLSGRPDGENRMQVPL